MVKHFKKSLILSLNFRKKGVERLLDKKCGTKPYVAPEVFLRPYRAGPADIWSCGVVLVAMLAGGKCHIFYVEYFYPVRYLVLV